MKRIAFIAVAALAIVVLGWRIRDKIDEKRSSGGGPGGGPRGGGDAAVPVSVQPVTTASIRDIRMFTGTLRADSKFLVAPKISGRLEAMSVQLGDPIEAGQLIAQLDDEEHVRRVEQAQAELEVARANVEKVRLDAILEDQELEQRAAQAEAELGIARARVAECDSSLNVAEREYERAQALRGKTIMSQSSLDEAEARYLAQKAQKEVALAQVAEREAALKATQVRLSEKQKQSRTNELLLAKAQASEREAALRSAEVQLGYTRIVAEWKGDSERRYVGERFADPGAMLSSTTPILSVVDIATLRAFINVIERDYPLMQVGQTAKVSADAYPGRIFEGRIARISNVLQETSRQARVEVEIPNPELLLKPGMFVRLEIEFAQRDDATVVPRQALVRHQDQQGVFLLDEEASVARFVPVTPGVVDAGRVEVIEPALQGSVVTLGQHLLSDGAPVVVSTFSLDEPQTED